MTEAEIGYQRVVEAGDPGYVSSVITVAANWLIAGVFLFWAIMGPPLDIGRSPVVHAIARGLLGILVLAVVRARPVSSGVAWVICMAFAGLGAFNWLTKGTPEPLHVWELAVAVAYSLACPLAVWQTTVRSAQQTSVSRAPSAGEPRVTPTSTSVALFGRVMANKIADLLEKGQTIVQGRKDFGGTGLAYVDGRFVYDDMKDGGLACLAHTPPSFDRALAIFSERASFVAWLAGQSDESLAGGRDRGEQWLSTTQRITLSQLRAVATESRAQAAS